MKDRMGKDLEGRRCEEKLGRVEGRETIFRIYCTKKESIFNKINCKKKNKIKKSLSQLSFNVLLGILMRVVSQGLKTKHLRRKGRNGIICH